MPDNAQVNYYFWNIVFNFQTLLGAILAIAGAWWTVSAIKRQIRHLETQETERRRRRNAAARSVMPAALSELCDYSE